MHFAHGDQAACKIGFLLRVGLAYNAFIAFACGTGLVRINTGDKYQLVLYFFVDFRQSVYIITDRLLVVGGAGTDDHDKFFALSGDHVPDLDISFSLYLHQMGGHGKTLADLVGGG